jgi:predicted phage tail protein
VVVLVVWDRPGLGAVLFIAVVALILVGVVQFLARGAASTVAPDNTTV